MLFWVREPRRVEQLGQGSWDYESNVYVYASILDVVRLFALPRSIRMRSVNCSEQLTRWLPTETERFYWLLEEPAKERERRR